MATKGTTQSSMHSTSTRLAHLLAQSSWIPCTPNFLEFLFSSCLRVIGSTMNLCSDNGRQLNAFTKRNFKTLSAPWLDTVQTVTRDAGSLICYSLGQRTLEAGIYRAVPMELGFVLSCRKVETENGYMIRDACDQDYIHNHKKLLNPLDHASRVLYWCWARGMT